MKTSKEKNNLHIVGIGASAGGLEALGLFFDNCAVDANIAFVIVQHLSPDYKSMMPDLLSRHTTMEVSVARHEIPLEPNKVYLIPVGKNITVKGGMFHLIDSAPRNEVNLPIDLFFESLAKEVEEKSIGVILSGTGSDGTRGSRVIKEVGGVIFAQDPQTTRFNGMPVSIIENGLADYILGVQAIPLEIKNYIEYPESNKGLLANNFYNTSSKNHIEHSTSKHQQEIKELKQALADNRESLQSTIKELDMVTSELEEAKTEIEELKDFLSEIDKVSPEVTYIYDLETHSNVYSSRSIGEILGYTKEEITAYGNKLLPMIMIEEELPKITAHHDRLKQLKNDEIQFIEYQMRGSGGKNKWVISYDKPFKRNGAGEVIQIIGVAQDITEAKDINLELERANEELKRFAYISSHDLKEPLNTVISLIDVIKMEMDKDAQVLDLLDLLDLSTIRMKRLIDDLLSYSLLEQQKIKVDEIDIEQLIQEIKQDLGSAIKESDAIITLEKVPTIKGDMTQIRQLFQNLISNAIKYRQSEPVIKIKAKEEVRNWLFSIEDNGIGIAKKNVSKIFEVFQKLHSNHEYEGTGIGLANCQRIVNNHKGKIWLESELGKGSTFYFTLAKEL